MDIQRRRFLQATTAVASLPFFGGLTGCTPDTGTRAPVARGRFNIGICDWDMYTEGDPGSFAIAKELGFDGVEVTYDPLGEYSLSRPENRRLFLEAAASESMKIPSFAMGILNTIPLATDDRAEGWVADCIEAMVEMNVKMVLLPFFANADIKVNLSDRNKAIEILKRLAPLAEANNVILGLESFLDAEQYFAMLDQIGSDAVMVYYDVQNMFFRENFAFQDFPIYDDLEKLLREKVVCQIHCKENYALLGHGVVDFPRVRDLLERHDYRGDWLIAETFPWSKVGEDGDWKGVLRADAVFLRETFNRG